MTETAAQNTPEKQTANPWFIFVLICIPILIGSIDLTAIVVILPQATLDLLGPRGLDRADQALWAVTAYLLAYTISLALVGRLSDVLPRKRVFVACIVIFIVGALWSGLATELPMQLLSLLPIWPAPDMLPLISLVIGRIIQAVGAGASVSVGMALIGDIFPPDKRAEPISLIGALDSLGWVIGNLWAGIMLQILPSWRWLFLINAGVALGALILTIVALRYAHSERPSGRFDWRGAILFAAALTALTIGTEALKNPSINAYLLIGGSLLLLVIFIGYQFRARYALIDMKFVRQREVRTALLTNLIVGFGLILIMAGVPVVINLRAVFLRGEGLLIGALRAGIMLCALTAPLIVAVLVGESRYRRVGAGIPVAMGLTLAMLGYLGASFWTYTAPSYVIALPLALVGVGLGLTIGPLSLVVIDAAEESARGLASSLVLVMRLLGMTIGTPLAASLTLTLANDWASARAGTLTEDFRAIARPMLIPPMAIDALARVLLAGAGACLVGLILFYLPRALGTLRRTGPSLRVLFNGLPALIIVIALVGSVAAWDSSTTPAILPNPIAQQLPPNVEFYAGINIQQAFLLNSRRPLDAAMQILTTMVSAQPISSPTDTPTPAPTPGAPAVTPTAPANPPTPATPPPPPDTPTDSIIKMLFRPRQWSNDNYKPFCAPNVPPDQYQGCFNGGLLSWVGPQAAFALLPRTRDDYDYLFVFQATNRNNAIQFATNLAAALDEAPPEEIRPNQHVLNVNAGTPDARQLAITDAYVMIGTPKAVEYTLNHGQFSLADQQDYQKITAMLPSEDIATLYFRSANIESEIRPALTSLFPSPVVDAFLRIAGRISPLAFARNTTAPMLVGMTLRVNEAQLMFDVVANLPFSLQKLNASPVSRSLLGLVPDDATAWVATNLNIAGIMRDLNIPDALDTIARESGNTTLAGLIANPLTQGPVMALVQTLQKVLTHAEGTAIFVTLGDNPAPGQAALILPLADREDGKASDAVKAIQSQLQLFALLGKMTIITQHVDGYAGEVTSVGGSLIEAFMPGGLHYTLTADNLLMITSGTDWFRRAGTLHGSAAVTQIQASLPGALNKFLYAYITSSSRDNAALVIGGEIRMQTLYLNAVLQTR